MPMGFGKGAGQYKPPKLGVIKEPGGMGRIGKAAMPKSAGSKDTKWVAGFNPRKGRYTASVGTNPAVPDPPKLTSAGAPFKHEAGNPGGKFALPGFNE